MSENSKIEWTDHTFNPWEGCQKVGPGCDHCYAETRNARFGGGQAINWGPGAPRRRTSPANWRKPLAWNSAHDKFFAQHGRRQRVFCASLADVFDNAVSPVWRADLFELIKRTPNLDWLLLTKRIGNAHEMMQASVECLMDADRDLPWPNVWIGATITSQAEADRDIPKLLEVPARVRFLSMEPLLGPVDLERPMPGPDIDQGGGARICQPWMIQSGIDWVIVGGESGHGARPVHPNWARSLRDQCAAAGVPFLFKQWGEWAPSENWPDDVAIPSGTIHYLDEGCDDRHAMWKVGKKAAGRLLDGVQHDGFPETMA
ncbi:phage Gp37/Gp68 family protein [Cupriavidus sp. Marseille-Q8015]